MTEKSLSVQNISKSFKSGDKQIEILSNVNFELKTGEITSLVGPSGSGKTTLLGLLAGLDKVDKGKIFWGNTDITTLNQEAISQLRSQEMGFVFQNFQLLPTLTALENVMIPMELKGMNKPTQRAKELLESVGLSERMKHYPRQMSGGEQQRVALARAFSNEPKILFADEPTGNLDETTGEMIENLIFELNKHFKTTLIIVTHDLRLANKTSRILKLKGGKILSDDALNTNIS